ncbi:carcinoembryonic antigen-related cell adhesion molecule 5-like [Oreochromis aureus]|uniref:Ig-like domain-containing protein n=1 Tax=Oreochromis aureus TaxID=47969 RepID=A0A668RPJ8_OREAU|nr:carcinoembryonic antigen-related cell adhesion molecule 5-like [Oreochromis aureus]
MDPLSLKSLLLLLPLLGCCVGQGILPEGPVAALVGGNVTLKTTITDQNPSVIIWTFNGQISVATFSSGNLKVAPAYTGRVSLNPTDGSLTLSALKPGDSGDYILNVITSDGTTLAGETKLQVVEPVSDVVIKSNVPDAIEYNSTVILTCSAKGTSLSFKWINGSMPIVFDSTRITEIKTNLSSMLTIKNVLRTDLVGPIYCTASNSLTTKTTTTPFNLTVYYGPDDVTIRPANPPKFVQAGSTFNLTCSASSLPPASFTWYCNGTMIGTSSSILTLDMIKAQGYTKAANYTCRAENPKSKRNVASPAVSFAIMEGISSVKIIGPTGVLIADNSTANLSCQATGGTVGDIDWLKDGKPLEPSSPRVVFAADGSSILISPLQKDDNGRFTCRVSNDVSSKEAHYIMQVVYGPEQPTIKADKAVEVNQRVELTCSAPSVPPANYTWKLNGTATTTTAAVFIITSAAYKDTGTYTCEARNIITGKTTTTSHNLSVRGEGTLDGLSDGAIAGIVIAVIIAVAVVVVGVWYYCRQKVPMSSPY